MNIFNKTERELLKRLQTQNDENINTWNWANVYLPLTIILFTLIIVGFSEYLKGHTFPSRDFFYALFNGSLSLIAINVLFLGLFSLINFNKHKEITYGLDINNLRTKLIVYFLILLALGWLLYGTQAVLAPIDDTLIKWCVILGCFALLAASKWLTQNIIMLQEEFIDKAYSTLGITGEKHLNDSTQKNNLLLKRN